MDSDPHAPHLLCLGICGANSKEHVARNNRTHVWQQSVVAANISWNFRIEVRLESWEQLRELNKTSVRHP